MDPDKITSAIPFTSEHATPVSDIMQAWQYFRQKLGDAPNLVTLSTPTLIDIFKTREGKDVAMTLIGSEDPTAWALERMLRLLIDNSPMIEVKIDETMPLGKVLMKPKDATGELSLEGG